MKKTAIFMSDFHLGQKNRLEEFHVDNEFAELLGRLSLEHEEDAVDLVLLGDVLDIWTTVTDAREEWAGTIADIDLYLPACSKDELRYAEFREAEKVMAIVRHHPRFFEALGRFLSDNPHKRRLIYIPGNHDHSMVSRKLQTIVTTAILTPDVRERALRRSPNATRERLVRCIRYQSFYTCDLLEAYAEHGNQLTYGGIFRYADADLRSTFDRFGSECPGYVQFKTVSSRGLRRAPKLNGWLIGAFNPANWLRLTFQLLVRGYVRALLYLQRFRIQYQSADNPKITWARDVLPAEWKTLLYLFKSRFVSPTHDEFGDVIPRLFVDDGDPTTTPLCGTKLNQNDVSTLILGHSHGPKDIDVPGFKNLKYYNTGSWILTQDKGREVVHQTWVRLTRQLPVTIRQIARSRSTASVVVENAFAETTRLRFSCSDLITGFAVGDQVLIDVDRNGVATSIVRDNPFSRKVIDRQMIRRRVELEQVAESPITTDGTPLDPVLRSMKLRVGDLVLFHWNFGAYLWRLATTHPLRELPKALPGVLTGAVNRWGTSSYWNHIAMVFGSPSEREEGHHYNDPLIIESVPGTGVGIHTPRHYLEYPKEWNFAVLRLKSDLLSTWEARRLLRRITAGYLGAVYDMETVVDGTVKHVALTMEAKGRSALSGAISGAASAFIVSTIGVIGVCGYLLYADWDRWFSMVRSFVADLNGVLARVVDFRPDWSTPWGAFVGNSLLVLASMLAIALIVYATYYIVRLLITIWIAVTAFIGAIAGFLIVPVMADIADGWTDKSTIQRIGFVLIWFSPLVIIYALGSTAGMWLGMSPEAERDNPIGYHVILLLFSALLTVLFAGTVANWANPLVLWLSRALERIGRTPDRVRLWLGWRVPAKTECPDETVHRQFICSGLLQDGLAETARELRRDLQSVVVNPDWAASQSRAVQACIFRKTLPKHFALSNRFNWTYLYLDEKLTEHPSESHKAQVYTASLGERTHVSRIALYAIKMGFAGAFLSIVGVGFSKHLASTIAAMSSLPSGVIDQQTEVMLFGLALTFGLTAVWLAKKAERELAIAPRQRGRALACYGLFFGAMAIGLSFANLEMLSGIPLAYEVAQGIVLFSIGSAVLLLF